MNILLASYYYKPHFGGVENSLFSLAKEYQKKGDNVFILASDAALDKKKRLPQYEVLDGIAIYRFRHFIPCIPLFYFFSPIADMLACWFFVKQIKAKYQINKVIVRHHILALPLLLLKWPEGIAYIVPGVVKFQDTLPLHNTSSNGIKNKFKKIYTFYILLSQQIIIQNIVFRKFEKLYVFSDTMRKQIIASVGNERINNKITRINPGVDLLRFAFHNREYERELANIRKEDFVFLCIGRLTVHKGFDFALHAFFSVKEKNPERKLKLLIVGDGPEMDKLKKIVNETELNNDVLFVGKTDAPEKYYGMSDTFIMSSIYEPFGQTIIEAMASSLPVIAFKSGGSINTATSQIVTDDLHGFLCDFSIEDLARSMKEAIDMTYEKKKKIKYNVVNHVKDNYSWSSMTEIL